MFNRRHLLAGAAGAAALLAVRAVVAVSTTRKNTTAPMAQSPTTVDLKRCAVVIAVPPRNAEPNVRVGLISKTGLTGPDPQGLASRCSAWRFA